MNGAPDITFQMRPIGIARTPFSDTAEVPKGPGAEHKAEGVIEIRPDLEAGLTDIDGFSHLILIWVFDRSKGYDLMVTPPTDDRPHGLFSTRVPRRPNPLAITIVELLSRDGTSLRVRGLDMLDSTPILDIKPYLSSIPADQIRRGWLDEADARRRTAH